MHEKYSEGFYTGTAPGTNFVLTGVFRPEKKSWNMKGWLMSGIIKLVGENQQVVEKVQKNGGEHAVVE